MKGKAETIRCGSRKCARSTLDIHTYREESRTTRASEIVRHKLFTMTVTWQAGISYDAPNAGEVK